MFRKISFGISDIGADGRSISFWIKGSGYLITDHVPDIPMMLLNAVSDILEGKETDVEMTWEDYWPEVGEGFTALRLVEDQIYLFAEGEKTNAEKIDFAKSILYEFELYENGNGRHRYEHHYRPFPQQAYDRLKQLVKVNK